MLSMLDSNVRSWIQCWVWLTHRLYKTGMFCFFTNHTVLRSLIKDLFGQSLDNVFHGSTGRNKWITSLFQPPDIKLLNHKTRRILTQLDSKRFSNNQCMWHTIKICGIWSRHVAYNQDMWHTIKACGIRSKHVAHDQDMWHMIKTCGTWSRHVAYDQDMWHTIKKCGTWSIHVAYDQGVAYNQDMWHAIKTCGTGSQHVAHD